MLIVWGSFKFWSWNFQDFLFSFIRTDVQSFSKILEVYLGIPCWVDMESLLNNFALLSYIFFLVCLSLFNGNICNTYIKHISFSLLIPWFKHLMASMLDPSLKFFCPLIQACPSQHHFKRKLSYQIQCWLCINCRRAFFWELTYPLQNWNSSGGC